jgi:hypothetical protein
MTISLAVVPIALVVVSIEMDDPALEVLLAKGKSAFIE